MSSTTFFRLKETIRVTLVPDEGEPLVDTMKHKSINAAKRESRALQKRGMKFVWLEGVKH